MIKNSSLLITHFSKISAILFSTILIVLTEYYIYSDIKYYHADSELFSIWQLPLFLILNMVLLFILMWLLFTKRTLQYILGSILLSLSVVFIPYQNYGDFKKLRLISHCEGDGKLCKEGVYPYLTKQWCIENGYLFDEKTRFCSKRK